MRPPTPRLQRTVSRRNLAPRDAQRPNSRTGPDSAAAAPARRQFQLLRRRYARPTASAPRQAPRVPPSSRPGRSKVRLEALQSSSLTARDRHQGPGPRLDGGRRPLTGKWLPSHGRNGSSSADLPAPRELQPMKRPWRPTQRPDVPPHGRFGRSPADTPAPREFATPHPIHSARGLPHNSSTRVAHAPSRTAASCGAHRPHPTTCCVFPLTRRSRRITVCFQTTRRQRRAGPSRGRRRKPARTGR